MVNVEFELRTAGYCKQIEKITNNQKPFHSIAFPAHFAIIRHPGKGIILVDTGYSEHFLQETTPFPYSIYARVTPVIFDLQQSAKKQLELEGIEAADVSYIIITHFHADHISGLKDFPNAQFICLSKGYHYVWEKTGIRALLAGFVPTLLPEDFHKRTIFLEDGSHAQQEVVENTGLNIFNQIVYDVFADCSILAVELPGHARGQIGLLIQSQDQQYFIIADAVWDSDAFRYHQLANPIAGIILDNSEDYRQTVQKLHTFHLQNSEVKMIPLHCREWDRGDTL